MGNMILFLEDDAHLRRYTTRLLEEDGYWSRIISVGRIDLANDCLKKHADNVGCIITDLNMSDEWLQEYQRESDGCILSGWVWLQRFVFPKEGMENIPCIIYSGFNKYLINTLTEKKQSFLLQKPNLLLVDKGAGENAGYTVLLNALKKVLRPEE